MIYFVANWHQKEKQLQKERIMATIQLFSTERQEHQLILLNYLPFLRYKFQEHNLSSDKCFSTYDVVQNIKTKTGNPIGVEDLSFPENIEKIHHPSGITLIQSGKLYGSISFNQYGCLEKVACMDNHENKVDYYDERGFLSTREYVTHEGVLFKREYFNEYGKHTVSEYFGDNRRIIIEESGNPKLKNKTYRTMDEVVRDVIFNYSRKFNRQTDALITLSDVENYRILEGIQEKIKLFFIVPEEQKIEQMPKQVFIDLVSNNDYLIAETTDKKQKIEQLMKYYEIIPNGEIVAMSMYATKLLLGNSNSITQMIIYFKVSDWDKKNLKLYEHLIEELIKNSDYKLILHVEAQEIKAKLMGTQKQIVEQHYSIDSQSEEYKKVEHYLQSKKNMRLFQSDKKSVEDIRQTEQWHSLVCAVDVFSRIQYQISPSVNTIKQLFYQSRIYIDINNQLDLQMQSMAASSGIPLIIRRQTNYIVDRKNGWVVNKHSEALKAIDYFLKELKHWNVSLVESVNVIKKNNSKQLIKKWRQLLDE